jgi:cell division transport system permease protein
MRNALTGVERALFLTLVFATFAATAAGLAARAVDRLAERYDQDRNAYAIVRVVAPEGPAAIAAAEAALAQSPLVSSAAPMTAGRAAALLERWGGGGLPAQDMPPLRLIEIELAPPGPDVIDVPGELIAALAQGGVTAEVIQAPDSEAGGGLAGQVRTFALWGAVAFALVMAVIVSLAARSLAARRREMVTVMCDLGATRGQAAGRIADEAAILGLYAGVAGALLAGVTALVIMLLAIPRISFETLPQMILPLDLVPIVAAPLITAIAAGAGARAAASYFHGQAARLG